MQLSVSEWTNFTQRHHNRTATKHYREVLSDPSQPAEVRERAQKAMINAQIATIEFHERNLNIVSSVEVPQAIKSQERRAAGSKNAELQRNALPKNEK